MIKSGHELQPELDQLIKKSTFWFRGGKQIREYFKGITTVITVGIPFILLATANATPELKLQWNSIIMLLSFLAATMTIVPEMAHLSYHISAHQEVISKGLKLKTDYTLGRISDEECLVEIYRLKDSLIRL